MSLTTLPDLKTFLGVPCSDVSQDALLNLLITQVSDSIEEYCGRRFGQQTYTEYYEGNGSQYFCLNQRPVILTGFTLWLDEGAFWGQAAGAFASSTQLTLGTDYAVELDGNAPDTTPWSRSGRVLNINGYWPEPFSYNVGLITPLSGPDVGNIKVTYTAGYGTVPSNVELACNMQISKIRRMRTYGTMVTGESYENYSYELAKESSSSNAISGEVASLLARYRNVAVG